MGAMRNKVLSVKHKTPEPDKNLKSQFSDIYNGDIIPIMQKRSED